MKSSRTRRRSVVNGAGGGSGLTESAVPTALALPAQTFGVPGGSTREIVAIPATTQIVADAMYYTPMVVTRPITITEAMIRVTTGVVGATATVAIYNTNEELVVGTLVAKVATFATATNSTTVLSGVLAIDLEPGIYLSRIHFSGANAMSSASGAVIGVSGTLASAFGSVVSALRKLGTAYTQTPESPGTAPTAAINIAAGAPWTQMTLYRWVQR